MGKGETSDCVDRHHEAKGVGGTVDIDLPLWHIFSGIIGKGTMGPEHYLSITYEGSRDTEIRHHEILSA